MARQAANEALEIQETSLEAQLLLQWGRLEIYFGDVDLAEAAFARSLQLLQHDEQPNTTMPVLAEEARIQLETGNREQGMRNLRECAAAIPTLSADLRFLDLIEILQRYAPELCDADSIIRYLSAFESKSSASLVSATLIRLRMAKAAAQSASADYEASRANIAEAAAITDREGLAHLRAEIFLQIAQLARKCGRSDEAYKELLRAEEAASTSPDWFLRRRILTERAEVHKERGENKEAFDLQQLTYALVQDKRRQQSLRRIRRYQKEEELEKLRHERDTLREQVEKALTEIESLRKSRELYLSRNERSIATLRQLKTLLVDSTEPPDDGLMARIRSTLAQVETLTGDVRTTASDIDLQPIDQSFLLLLGEKYPKLTTAERRICALLRANIVGKKLAETLHISTRSMQTYRSRIRRKLGLGSEDDLDAFIKQIE